MSDFIFDKLEKKKVRLEFKDKEIAKKKFDIKPKIKVKLPSAPPLLPRNVKKRK